jgi:predicted tellurium resistance membrane protein TerC
MAVAAIASMVVLIVAAGPVGKFVDRHPTEDAGARLPHHDRHDVGADAFGVHVPKGWVYSAMIFSVAIEGVNMLHRRKGKPVHLHNQYGPEVAPAVSGGRRAIRQAT